jgi:hypothetical protein
MSRVEFETTILEFKRAKTVHVLDRAATVIGEGRWIVDLIYCTKPFAAPSA